MNTATNALDIFSGLLSPIVAIIVTYIAYQQWRLNNYKFILDRFDRRYPIYKAILIYLSGIARDGAVSEKHPLEFLSEVRDAQFLFKEEIWSHINEIYSKSVNAQAAERRLKSLPVGPKRDEMVEKESELLKWLVEQLVELPKKFKPYLDINQ